MAVDIINTAVDVINMAVDVFNMVVGIINTAVDSVSMAVDTVNMAVGTILAQRRGCKRRKRLWRCWNWMIARTLCQTARHKPDDKPTTRHDIISAISLAQQSSHRGQLQPYYHP